MPQWTLSIHFHFVSNRRYRFNLFVQGIFVQFSVIFAPIPVALHMLHLCAAYVVGNPGMHTVPSRAVNLAKNL